MAIGPSLGPGSQVPHTQAPCLGSSRFCCSKRNDFGEQPQCAQVGGPGPPPGHSPTSKSPVPTPAWGKGQEGVCEPQAVLALL